MKPFFFTTSIFLTLAFTVLPSRGSTILVGISFDFSSVLAPQAFYLDFELQDGSGTGDGNNTSTIQAIYFGGTMPPRFNLVLTDTSVLNSLQEIVWSTTHIAFETTTAVDTGGTPDQFRIKIPGIPTEGPDDAFLILDIDSANPVFQTFRSDLLRTSIDIPAPGVSYDAIPMPESGVPTTLIIALWVSALVIWRRQVSVQ